MGVVCKKCGAIKEGSYAKESMCAPCMSEYRKQKRLEKRLAQGKNPWSKSGRNPLCSKCGAQKDEQHLGGGYCKTCKAEVYRAKRAALRAEKGLPAWGSGRKIRCCGCGAIKEDKSRGYCLDCKKKKERERYEKKRLDFDYVIAERKRIQERYKEDPIFNLKKKVRTLTNFYIRNGLLTRNPCEVCGELKVDAHHDDYMRPLDVRWLCRKHHNEHHRNLELKEL